MIIYRVMVKTSPKGGTFMDGTRSMQTAVEEARSIQAEDPQFVVSVEAEEWPTLTPLKYQWYRLTGQAQGFGVEFQKSSGHRHASRRVVWPEASAT